MKAKAASILLLAAVVAVVSAGCSAGDNNTAGGSSYEDGTYRGGFSDLGYIQVNLEFVLEDGVVTEASFRHLERDEDYHMDTDREPYKSVIRQYEEALEYLVGKDLQAHLADLYHPEDVVTTQVDGYTAATVRSNKIISAIRDALNRGVYSY